MSYVIREQQRCRSTCASAQPDQYLCCSLLRYYDMYTCYNQSYKILARFCGWADWFEWVTGRFAHFPVRPESFRPGSFRPRVVSPSYPESFRPLIDESFRPLFSRLVFYWGYCDKFTAFVSFNENFDYFLKHLIGPSSAEANNTYTCILFKLTSKCDDKDAIWDFSLFYDFLDFFFFFSQL